MDSYTALSEVYDKLMYDVDYDSWASYVISLLPEGCKRIAETACGTGSITLRLAAEGYSVTASDKSPEMLDNCLKKRTKIGLKPRFICQDMVKLSLPFQHAIICCCDGVNYLTKDEDMLSFFKGAYSSLKEGGRLLFDISSYHKISEVLKDNFFYDDEEDVTVFWQNSFDECSKCVTMSLTFFKRLNGNNYFREDEEHIQRGYKIDEILGALKSAGFSQCRSVRFLTLDDATDSDERIQFIAQK